MARGHRLAYRPHAGTNGRRHRTKTRGTARSCLMEINRPDVVTEVRAAFDRYEKALVTNDVATLNELFREDDHTIRYGKAENLYGAAEIAAFRTARSPHGLTRTLSRTAITS